MINTIGSVTGFLLVAFGALGPPRAAAQDVFHVYGASEVSPALHQAALEFTKRHDVRAGVTVGPSSTWLTEAKAEADLFFAEDLATMAHFSFSNELSIDPSTITPLYVRAAVILVRPGNPKEIHDLPDLVKPNVRVMAANEAGRAGLWKELASRLDEGELLYALNKNIAFVPANTTDAMELWREWSDIDAWITWNVWHMPLRYNAQVVPISSEYTLLRQCGIALTRAGAAKPQAAQFARFLTSHVAADIFESWAWSRPLPNWNPPNIKGHACIACEVNLAQREAGMAGGLAKLQQLLADYRSAGVDPNDVHISAIVGGDAAHALLKDAAYASTTGQQKPNPDSAVISELIASGVSLEVSVQTLEEHGWSEDDVLPGVKVVDRVAGRLNQLAQQGYNLMKL